MVEGFGRAHNAAKEAAYVPDGTAVESKQLMFKLPPTAISALPLLLWSQIRIFLAFHQDLYIVVTTIYKALHEAAQGSYSNHGFRL